MSDLKIGDRVEVILPKVDRKYLFGEIGTIVDLKNDSVAVEFDKNINGHNASGTGKQDHCWWIPPEFLKKTNETKVDTLERRILEALREEIGVEIGEEFDVCENGKKQWTCKFEENGHLARCHENGKFSVTFIWKYWVFHFEKYVFKKRLSFLTKEEPYFYVQMRLDNNGNAIYDGVDYVYWYGKDFDIAMLITGNYFKTEEEAESNKEKVIERMNKLLKGE